MLFMFIIYLVLMYFLGTPALIYLSIGITLGIIDWFFFWKKTILKDLESFIQTEFPNNISAHTELDNLNVPHQLHQEISRSTGNCRPYQAQQEILTLAEKYDLDDFNLSSINNKKSRLESWMQKQAMKYYTNNLIASQMVMILLWIFPSWTILGRIYWIITSGPPKEVYVHLLNAHKYSIVSDPDLYKYLMVTLPPLIDKKDKQS